MNGKRSGSSGIGLERLCAGPSSDWIRSTDVVNGVELLEAWLQGYGYHKHRHDTYGICLTEIGVQAVDYRGAAETSTPGKVVVLHPDELHDGHAGTEQGFGYVMLYADSALISFRVEFPAACCGKIDKMLDSFESENPEWISASLQSSAHPRCAAIPISFWPGLPQPQ